MPEQAGEDSYRLVFEEIVKPVAEEFGPQIIIRNGGGDPYFGDRLTNLGLSLKGLRMIESIVREICKETGSKVLDLIVSGYSEKYSPLSWISLIAGLMGKKIDIKEPKLPDFGNRPLNDMGEVVNEIKNIHKSCWAF